MARIARVVLPRAPHLITQSGNRRQPTFFQDDDYTVYLELMAEWCRRCRVQVWAYCLMPNHVHLIAVPATETGLARAVGEAHRRYTLRVNLREDWRGHLWQERFASFPMDQAWLMRAARYVELAPVRAKVCRAPWRYPWSSARAHLDAADDLLVKTAPLLKRAGFDWKGFLLDPLPTDELELIRRHQRTGRPLGSERFLIGAERTLGRILRPRKRGPKPRRRG